MLKKILYLILFFLFSILFIIDTNSYSVELVYSGSWITIKELKNDIENLDKTNSWIINELNELNENYKLKLYLNTNLSLSESYKLRKIVSDFNTIKNKLDIELNEKINNKNDLIEIKIKILNERKNFYESLIPYINNAYYNDFIDYVREELRLFNEKNNLITNITLKKEILNQKLWRIEEKIQEHKVYLNKNIKIIIEKTIDEKILNLSNNSSFILLDTEKQKLVIQKTIDKIDFKLNELLDSSFKTSTGSLFYTNSELFDKKVQIYFIAIEKLKDFRNSIE